MKQFCVCLEQECKGVRIIKSIDELVDNHNGNHKIVRLGTLRDMILENEDIKKYLKDSKEIEQMKNKILEFIMHQFQLLYPYCNVKTTINQILNEKYDSILEHHKQIDYIVKIINNGYNEPIHMKIKIIENSIIDLFNQPIMNDSMQQFQTDCLAQQISQEHKSEEEKHSKKENSKHFKTQENIQTNINMISPIIKGLSSNSLQQSELEQLNLNSPKSQPLWPQQCQQPQQQISIKRSNHRSGTQFYQVRTEHQIQNIQQSQIFNKSPHQKPVKKSTSVQNFKEFIFKKNCAGYGLYQIFYLYILQKLLDSWKLTQKLQGMKLRTNIIWQKQKYIFSKNKQFQAIIGIQKQILQNLQVILCKKL